LAVPGFGFGRGHEFHEHREHELHEHGRPGFGGHPGSGMDRDLDMADQAHTVTAVAGAKM